MLNQQHIQELIDHIEEHLADEINVIGLASSFSVSPWHFQRTFKSLVGDTLGGYIRGRRLSRAAELLLATDRTIIDVAFSVGFSSHEAFSRSFKAYFNCGPKAFRSTKPQVSLEEKPLLTGELYQHLADGMQKEACIRFEPAKTIIGYDAAIPSPFTSEEDYCDLLYEPWTRLLKREHDVNTLSPGSYFGLMLSPSGNFTEEKLRYLAGIPVMPGGKIPSDMTVYEFPAQQVAMFDIYAGTQDSLARTVDYIYGYWLPNSPFNRGDGNDYEWFETVTSFEDPDLTSKYVMPVKEKKR